MIQTITVGIFSHTRPIAKAFLKQIKREFETNDRLKGWFPDILFADPAKDSPKWSEDEGIIVKRVSNPKESTVEAWGVVDGQPTAKHFKILVYDDVVTKESVSTPEMIDKTTESLRLSYNLGARGGHRRFIGTRYHFNDSYREILAAGTATPRIYPATVEGTVDGEPVFLTREALAKKRADMGPYVFGCQMLQDPDRRRHAGLQARVAALCRGASPRAQHGHPRRSRQRQEEGLATTPPCGASASAPIARSTSTTCCAIALSLTERADTLIRWHRKWKPMAVGYEHYGMQADIEHIQYEQEQQNYRFDITALGGTMPKNDRIRRLIPWFEKGRIYLHPKLAKTNYEGRAVDLTQTFIEEEYCAFPVAVHDDMLDALARFLDEDLPIAWPMTADEPEEEMVLEQGRNPITGY